MTAQSDPYVRVYYRIIDDPKFADVYDNDHLLAGWLRLLLVADAMYPAPAQIPHGIRRGVMDTLASVGLVELLNGDRFRLVGLRPERERRSEQARKAAQSRYEKAANAMHEQSGSSAGASVRQLHSEPLRSAPIRTAPVVSKVPDEEVPFVALTKEQQAEALQREQDELMKKIGWKVGVAALSVTTEETS